MKDKNIFFDTNLLVYAFLSNDNQKHETVKSLLEKCNSLNVFISTQIINEIYSALTKNKIGHNYIRQYIFDLKNMFNLAIIDFNTITKCLMIKEKYGFSYWDSLVAASALENGCTTLYSEDMQHNQLIENKLRIVNPFV